MWKSFPCIDICELSDIISEPLESNIFLISFMSKYFIKCSKQNTSDNKSIIYSSSDEGYFSHLFKSRDQKWNICANDWNEFIRKIKNGPPFISKKGWNEFMEGHHQTKTQISWTVIDNVPCLHINDIYAYIVSSPISLVIKDRDSDYYNCFNISLPNNGLINCVINENGTIESDDIYSMHDTISWTILSDNWDEFITKLKEGPPFMTNKEWISYRGMEKPSKQ